MGNFVCTPYDREGSGLVVQTVPPPTILMLEDASFHALVTGRDCNQGMNLLTIPATTSLRIRQTLSACPITHYHPAIDASTQLAIHQMQRNNRIFL